MSWATVGDVLLFTGQTVTDGDIAPASTVIDIYSNRTEAASGAMRPRDLKALAQATAFQTVWQMAQSGYYEREVANSLTQDGISVQQYQSQQDLAPLAIRALKNLSWKGSRPVQAPNVAAPAVRSLDRAEADFLSDQDGGGWVPL